MNLNEYVTGAMRTDLSPEQYDEALRRISNNREVIQLLHAAIGLTTEVGEFMDILKKHIFYGKAIDFNHVREELGDVSWYFARGAKSVQNELTSEPEEILVINLSKLRQRYPEAFNEENALFRDLQAEHKILEGNDKPKPQLGLSPVECRNCFSTTLSFTNNNTWGFCNACNLSWQLNESELQKLVPDTKVEFIWWVCECGQRFHYPNVKEFICAVCGKKMTREEKSDEKF